jgi:hypothetical protein
MKSGRRCTCLVNVELEYKDEVEKEEDGRQGYFGHFC